jgi:protein-S-isoprenylcysteine O-methyltransferase Ste14
MTQRLIRQSIVWFVILAALLFIPAGTFAWPGAWVYLAEIAVTSLVITVWMLRNNPALLAERMAPLIQRDQKTWDKVLMATLLVLWCAWFVLMGLDAVRYAWSVMPLWAQVVGGVAIIIGMRIVFLTVRANSFAAPVVKIQAERGHKVVSHGPYAVVRHPMYAGALLMLVGTPLLLGSWWGLAAVSILALLLGLRAVMEERTLAAELDGYAEYAARVRYRLIPLIW